MPLGSSIGWWSPDPRGVIPLDGLHVSRSLRRACRRYKISMNEEFEAVINACADPQRPHGWIDHRMREAYIRLHELGWAHSVETWQNDELVGGLYGVVIGGLFAGESMFHKARDASKAALVALVDELRGRGASLLDVQWATPHLQSLGAVEIPREEYLARLAAATNTTDN